MLSRLLMKTQNDITDSVNIMRRVIPFGMVLATMVSSVLVALQSSPVPALLAGTHDEPKPCAVTGPLNSTVFEGDLVGYMPRRTPALHVKITRDLATAYDVLGRCPVPGPCTRNSAWYTEWLATSPTPRGQALPANLTGFVTLSWATVLVGLVAYVGCYVRLETRVPTKANPSRFRIGSEPSLIHTWQRKTYDLAALELGLQGVTAYVLWALGCVSAALLEFPMDLNTMSVALVVLVPLLSGCAVVTVMGQLSFGCLVMYISALTMIGHDHLGLAGTTPWWAVWGMVTVAVHVARRCISSGDVAFVLLCQVGRGMMWLNALAAAAAFPSYLGQLPAVVFSVDWAHMALLVLSWTTASLQWAAAAPFFGQLPGIVLSVMASEELRTCASLIHSWATVLTPWAKGLALWAITLGATMAFSSWAFDVASWEYGVAYQSLARPKALFLGSFKEHLDNNHERVTGMETPLSRRSKWVAWWEALKQSGVAARWETFKSAFHVLSAFGRPVEIAWGIGVVAGSWGVPFTWPNLALAMAAAVLFSLALPSTRKRCMLQLFNGLAPAGHIFGLCVSGVLMLCMPCDSTPDTSSDSWSCRLFKEVQKDADWISCYVEESQKVLGATERCCTLADKRYRALVRGTNMEVLVLGRDFGWKDVAPKSRRKRRPRPPSFRPDPQPECDRALCLSFLGAHVLSSTDLEPLPDLPPPERSGTGETTTTPDSTTSEGTRTPSQDFTLWAQGAMSTPGTTAGAAMCCGKTKAVDIRTLVETHLAAGEEKVARLMSLETALRDHRRLYTQEQYRKYGAVASGATRERAGKNAKCFTDRLELHCALFANNPVWAHIVPSGEAPAPPEVLADTMVLSAVSRAKLTLKIAEEQLSEAEQLGIETESVEVEGEWEEWPADKQKFVAEVGRMNIIDAQVEFLRRLGEAARLQEPGSDLQLATAEQAKGWRSILAPERVDLTGDEDEGGSGPGLRLAETGAGDDGLTSLTSLTARATIGSGPETTTAAEFQAFVKATAQLQQDLAKAMSLSTSRLSTQDPPKDREPSGMWKRITQQLLATAGTAHASSDLPRLTGRSIPGARTKTQLTALPGSKDSLLTGEATPERDYIERFERQRQDEAAAAAQGMPRACNPVCYQCTSYRIEEARKENGRGMEEIFSASEWEQHQVHMSRPDAVTCTLSQHGSGSASLYCGPAVGVATVCVLCHYPQFIQGLPSPVCSNCGVSYIEPIKGTYEPKNRKAPLGIGKKELIAATMAAMVGGGGDWVQREKLPDRMMELLCRAWRNPRDDMIRYPRLAVMVWCGCRLDCGLHPEFAMELKDKAGRYSAPFTSIPHMDMCLHARLFQSTSDRMKPFNVPTKDGSMNPTAADLKTAALKELKSVPDWPWRKEPLFQYESGVILLLGATRN